MMLGEQYNHSEKKYIDVYAIFHADGSLTPVSIIWDDGRKFEIDMVKDVRRAASLKAGGCGMRYTCMIQGKQVNLFLEEDRWFIEMPKSKSESKVG